MKETIKLVGQLEAYDNERKRVAALLLELPRKIVVGKVRQYLLT